MLIVSRTRNIAAAAIIAAVIAATSPAAAQSVADFYKGKTIAMVMGTGPGGSYDLYGRTIAPHLSRHIPGNPSIIMEHMPGAGRRTAPRFCCPTPSRCRRS
jgi:tripartite-type tricarboxylate transporter receptor subunit TctC